MKKGDIYIIAVMDWYSRKVLSWKISNTIDEQFCVSALKEAFAKFGKPLIFNTDQGSQFTGEVWINVLKEKEINISMDGKGRAIDNVMIERIWGSYKYEYLYLNVPECRNQLREGTEKWMNWYNENLNYQSQMKTPDRYYAHTKRNIAA
jgi:putative transposase